MSDEKKPELVEVELLAHGMLVDGVAHVTGDTVRISKQQADRLTQTGDVGPVGTIKKRDEAKRKAADLHAEAEAKIAEAHAAGRAVDQPQPELTETAPRGPGRPRAGA